MPCNKVTITKNNKCDTNSCFCLPTKGSYICLCNNKMGDITRCDCKCERNLCKCGDNCTCMNTALYSCICVCRDEQGKIMTCVDCCCNPKQEAAGSCRGKSVNVNCGCKRDDVKGGNSCIYICSDEKGSIKTCGGCSCVPEQAVAVSCKGKSATENCGCKCDDGNCICLSLGGNSCKCICRDEMGNIKTCGGCECKSSVVSCKETYAQGVKLSNDGASKACKCQGNASSCICVCKNKQGETVCCDVCNCKENNRCDKNGCICVPKESNIDVGKYVNKCIRFENTDSCICVCENKQENLVLRVDCKCDDNNTCNKKGCTCVSTGFTAFIKAASSKTDCFCKTSPVSCKCVCKNKQGELVCCDDCKCDDNNTCNKKECTCVPKGSSTCIKAASFKTDCFCKTSPVSCECVCKNKQGELVCCDVCKCNNDKSCNRQGCACVSKKSVTCEGGCSCNLMGLNAPKIIVQE